MMISQVNFARPWDMSGSAAGNATTIGNNNNSSNCFITGNDHHRLTNAASTLGLAPLQVRANSRLVEVRNRIFTILRIYLIGIFSSCVKSGFCRVTIVEKLRIFFSFFLNFG